MHPHDGGLSPDSDVGTLAPKDQQKGYMKKLKEEYQPGGSKRHVILDKAVEYLKDPRFGLQGDKHSFLTEQLGLSESEYLTCLNEAASGDWDDLSKPWRTA